MIGLSKSVLGSSRAQDYPGYECQHKAATGNESKATISAATYGDPFQAAPQLAIVSACAEETSPGEVYRCRDIRR